MNILLAILCVILFGLTVPVTRVATLAIDPVAVAALRLCGAGLICGLWSLTFDRWIPPRKLWFPLLSMAVISVGGFSVSLALAMKRVPGTHGAIAMAALPALTAAYASLRDRFNPGFRFWFFCVLGTLISFLFFAIRADSSIDLGDWYLVIAVLTSAFGYVEGGRMSRTYGGRRIMTWGIFIAWPFATAVVLYTLANSAPAPFAIRSWFAVGYLSLVSQSLGMFLWFTVLARGPMARIALVQLLQPFFTLLGSMVLLGEQITDVTWATAFAVAGCVFGANRAKKTKA